MIRKLKSGEFRLYSRKLDPKTGKRRNLGTFRTLEAAKKRADNEVLLLWGWRGAGSLDAAGYELHGHR